MLLADNLDQLLEILPDFIRKPLQKSEKRFLLIEIVLDIGRRPEARFSNGVSYLSYRTIVWQDLDYILKRLGKFSGDNRAGIEKTLHRISALRNRRGGVIGLTCRIGRAVFGTVGIICDLLEQKKSILLLGRPGVGKTTAIREIGRVLSDDMKKRVIIIDTSNEIAGDGDLPHPSIGKARRMQVINAHNQHEVMIEAVENHMPEVIIIDEIGTELEATAARTIAERGVQLVGTAHGSALENLIKNPTLTDLVGGIQYVTLGDEEARRRGSSKSILERKALPTFDIAVEIHDPKTWVIHSNIEQSVDLLLRGQNLPLQQRTFMQDRSLIQCSIGSAQHGIESIKNNIDNKLVKSSLNSFSTKENNNLKTRKNPKINVLTKKELGDKFTFLYAYGINTQDLCSVIKTLNLPVIVTRELQYADGILALSNLIKNNKKLRQISNSRNLNIYAIQNNNLLQISRALKQLLNYSSFSVPSKKEERIKRAADKLLSPLEEVRLVIEEVIIFRKYKVDLLPRTSRVRRLQHEIVKHYHLTSISIGNEPNRRVRIYPNNIALV
jgi:stage III sporulation protein SpoIIIAA